MYVLLVQASGVVGKRERERERSEAQSTGTNVVGLLVFVMMMRSGAAG